MSTRRPPAPRGIPASAQPDGFTSTAKSGTPVSATGSSSAPGAKRAPAAKSSAGAKSAPDTKRESTAKSASAGKPAGKPPTSGKTAKATSRPATRQANSATKDSRWKRAAVPVAASSREAHPPRPVKQSGIEAGNYSVSWRALMLVVVLAVAFVLLAPTLRLYLRQQAKESAINEQVAAAEARNAQVEREISRWQDPAYIQAQARERLGFVMPGQQTYLVVDPEVIVGEEAQAEYEEANAAPELPPGPWYFQVWDSIQVAGQTPVAVPEG